jgi:hypothetical protein
MKVLDHCHSVRNTAPLLSKRWSPSTINSSAAALRHVEGFAALPNKKWVSCLLIEINAELLDKKKKEYSK